MDGILNITFTQCIVATHNFVRIILTQCQQFATIKICMCPCWMPLPKSITTIYYLNIKSVIYRLRYSHTICLKHIFLLVEFASWSLTNLLQLVRFNKTFCPSFLCTKCTGILCDSNTLMIPITLNFSPRLKCLQVV